LTKVEETKALKQSAASGLSYFSPGELWSSLIRHPWVVRIAMTVSIQ